MPVSAGITPISSGTITSPQGFSAGGVFIGLNTCGEDKLDLAMLVSGTPCSIGGVLATSATRSATVDLDRERVARGRASALIVNAGIANTGVGAHQSQHGQTQHPLQRMNQTAAMPPVAQPRQALSKQLKLLAQ